MNAGYHPERLKSWPGVRHIPVRMTLVKKQMVNFPVTNLVPPGVRLED